IYLIRCLTPQQVGQGIGYFSHQTRWPVFRDYCLTSRGHSEKRFAQDFLWHSPLRSAAANGTGERSVAEQLIEAAEHGFKTLRVKNPQVAVEAIHRDRFHLTEQDMPAPALEGAGHPERRRVVAGDERRHGDLADERVRLIR